MTHHPKLSSYGLGLLQGLVPEYKGIKTRHAVKHGPCDFFIWVADSIGDSATCACGLSCRRKVSTTYVDQGRECLVCPKQPNQLGEQPEYSVSWEDGPLRMERSLAKFRLLLGPQSAAYPRLAWDSSHQLQVCQMLLVVLA